MWTEAERTYDGATWIAYLVQRLLSPEAKPFLDAHRHEDPRLASFTADHVVNGRLAAQGEDSDDRWGILVEQNNVFQCDFELTPTNRTLVKLY